MMLLQNLQQPRSPWDCKVPVNIDTPLKHPATRKGTGTAAPIDSR